MSVGKYGTVDAYCDMITADGGWIVIQRNGGISFERNWREYEEGFGTASGYFWYGLRLINLLTETGQWEMRVEDRYYGSITAYIHYNQFKVGGPSEKYKLTVGGYTSRYGDKFNSADQQLNNTFFSTLDNDNDQSESNCAIEQKSGWWFKNCSTVNPNVRVDQNYLVKEMKIRPKDCI